MKNITALSPEELALFYQNIQGTKKIKQDKVIHPRKLTTEQITTKKMLQEQDDANFYFSDQFLTLLEEDSPQCYSRADVDDHKLKKLRRGSYQPMIFLDLHGLTQRQAKKELATIIPFCRTKNIHCICVIHGHGKHILKKQIPHWLMQHPDILAFNQAPRQFGGEAALLVLIELKK